MTAKNICAAQQERLSRMVAYVTDCVAVPYGELFALFADDDSLDNTQAHKTFNRRIDYLLARRRIMVIAGRSKTRVFAPSPADVPSTDQAPKQQPKIEQPFVAKVAAPRCVNLMFTPVYVPGPGPFLRSGSQDHLRFKSLQMLSKNLI